MEYEYRPYGVCISMPRANTDTPNLKLIAKYRKLSRQRNKRKAAAAKGMITRIVKRLSPEERRVYIAGILEVYAEYSLKRLHEVIGMNPLMMGVSDG